jgi:alpha-galactosidase
VWKWGPEVGGNAWRTTGDIRDTWDSMTNIGFKQNDLAQWAKPGHWNDPDMLEIGNGGMNDDEYRTHMTLWSMLAAPLLAGNDLRTASPAILAILTNRDVIAIDQDKEGSQGHRAWKSGDQEIWVRTLASGDRAVAVLNRGAEKADVKVKWSELEMKAPTQAKNLWSHQDETIQGDGLAASVPSHGVVLLRVR